MIRSEQINIASSIVVLATVMAVLCGLRVPMFLPYGLHKMLHVFGVILFIGNTLVGPFWLSFASLRRDETLMCYLVKALAITDIVFTVPGVQLALWNGLAMAPSFGDVQKEPWLLQSLILLCSLSLLGPTVVWYFPEKLLRKTQSGVLDDAFRALFYRCSAWGSLLVFPTCLIVYLMVSKQLHT